MRYAEAGYALVAWPRSTGKGPRGAGWGLSAANPAAVGATDNIGLNHALSRTCSLDCDDLARTRQVLEFLGVDLEQLADSTMTWQGRAERMKLAFAAPDPMLPVRKLEIGLASGEAHVVLELRGAPDGKQAQDVLPPSIHPETQRPYEFLTPLRPREELPPLPASLLDLWRNWDALAPVLRRLLGCVNEPQQRRGAPEAKQHGGVIEQWNARHTAAEILERNGYTRRGERWLRPGSTTGMAGVVQLPDGAVYSWGGDVLSDKKPHDAFDVFRLLECGGDWSRAVRAAADDLGLRPRGNEAPRSDQDDQDDQESKAAKIEAKVWAWRDPRTIPPRPWLYGRHYMRGMVSATAGIGGAGKSTVLIVEAISQAIGRDLLAGGVALPVGPLRVWLHNGEDPQDELDRRLAAVMQHYQVRESDLGGRLSVTSGRDMPILVAKALSDGGKVFEPTGDGKALVAELKAKGVDVFMADPFVTLHRVGENDNVMVDAVMTILRNVAHQAQCALEVAHHLRKLNGEEATVDAIRGAGSIVGACRSVRLVAGMTREEAARYGIPEADRRAYLWLQNGKANMLPPTHARHWMRMEGVDLGNAAPPYSSDHVGVVTAWAAPDAGYTLTAPEFRALRTALLAVAQPLNSARYDVRAKGWVGRLIAEALELDVEDRAVKTQMRERIDLWIKAGRLRVERVPDPKQARTVDVVRWVDSGDES